MEKLSTESSRKRDCGTDLLRILLMLLIVIHHCLVHGLGFSNLKAGNPVPDGMESIVFFVLNGLSIVAVNAFFWISGFWGIKKNYKKLLLLYIECVFYMVIMQFVMHFIIGTDLSIRNILLPIRDYWFMGAYLLVALIAPFIYKWIGALNSVERWNLVIIITIINTTYGFLLNLGGIGDGYTAIQGLFMYILGCVFSYEKGTLEQRLNKRVYWFVVFLLCEVATSVVSWFFCNTSHYTYAWHFFAYNNPAICLGAVSLCMLFVNIKSDNLFIKLIGKASKYSLAIYLITDCYVIKKIVFTPVLKFASSNTSSLTLVLVIILYAAVLCVLCIGIDIIRKGIFHPLEKIILKTERNNK